MVNPDDAHKLQDPTIPLDDDARRQLRSALTRLAQAATRLEEGVYRDSVAAHQPPRAAAMAALDLELALIVVLGPGGLKVNTLAATADLRREYRRAMRDLGLYPPE